MGKALATAAEEVGVAVGGEVDIGGDLAAAAKNADVIVDFSFHTATRGVIEVATKLGKPVVIGTTGHDAAERAELREMASKIRAVWAGNYSMGVNTLFYLVSKAAKTLPEEYVVEITEMHHRFKKDAPSGTAARLAEVVLEGRGLTPEDLRYGREGIPGERTTREVGMHSLRGGDVVGDHTVMFAAMGERLELTHKASDRMIFARGAIHAAQWITGQPTGLYDMQDVLGLTD